MNTTNFYATGPRIPKSSSYRDYLIFKIQRDWPAMRLGLRNGRSLNRLSTKQLEAKYRQFEQIERKQRERYVKWLDSPSRQRHLIRFVAVKKISLLDKLHLVTA